MDFAPVASHVQMASEMPSTRVGEDSAPDDVYQVPASPLVPIRFMPRKRCSISLFFCFIVPITAIAAVYFTITWVTLNRSAVSTVERISSRLHSMTLLHVREEINDFLRMMEMLSDLTVGAIHHDVDSHNETEADLISNLFCRILSTSSNATYMFYGRPTGYALVARRLPWDSLIFVGERLADNNATTSSGFPNMTFRYASPTGKLEDRIESVHPYDPRTRPWYTIVANSTDAMFTPPYEHTIDGGIGVTLSAPLRSADGVLSAVVGVDYLMTSITSALFTAQSALQTSGLLLLINDEGELLASSTHDMPLSTSDVNTILAMPESQQIDVVNRFAGYGDCFVLQVPFRDKSSPVKAKGLNWRLVILLPKDEYYADITAQRNLQTGLILGCLLSFLVVMVLLSHLTIRLPLRRLRSHLMGLKSVVLSHTSLDMIITPSPFSEVAAVYEGVAVVVKAAEEAAHRRFLELNAAAELQKSQEENERLMRTKDLFFAMMSHEMRTPLTAVIGMAEVLLGTDLTSQQKECVDGISTSGTTLLSLINDVLDFSKIESGKLEIENSAFNIRECVEHASQVVQLKADEKSLELIVTIQSDIPERSVGDSCRLRQVLFNLMSNAVKFTQKGFVAISCSMVDDRKFIQFEVEDTGIGIPSSKLTQLFQPFTQADASMTRRYGGTGLGLVISKRIVEMLGGDLLVSSEGEGKGCVFRFTIPFVAPVGEINRKDQPRRSVEQTTVRPYTLARQFARSTTSQSLWSFQAGGENTKEEFSVLVLDRMERRRYALCELLRAQFFTVFQCPSVEELNDASTPGAALVAPLVVMHLTDWNTATIEKFRPETTSQAQDSPSSATASKPLRIKRRFIFIVSMKQGLSAPPDEDSAYISKPVTLIKLRQTITQLFPELKCNCTPTGTEISGCLSRDVDPGGPAPGGLDSRILVVDDVVLNQRVITMKLQQHGYTNIDVAADGAEALRLVRATVYSLILMDVMMPFAGMPLS